MPTYKEFLESGGEKKWQDLWEQKKLFAAHDFDARPKYYTLIEFPYPSAEGLHVGHPRSYTALDIVARKRRMQGFNVLYPIGFDAFGLPAENFAIKTGTHPRIQTEKNIDNYRRQLKSIGFSFDWDREVDTTDPKYYKWTQWIFLQLFKHGLAYKAEVPINFCTSCKVGLANEEVVGGQCERCGGEVVKKTKSQWMLKITDYAERLEKDLDQVDFLEKIKIQQRNWIGKSEGAEVDFLVSSRGAEGDVGIPSNIKGGGIATVAPLPRNDIKIKVYTTRPDTLFGATYMVLSPEHQLITNLKSRITNWDEVEEYVQEAAKKSDLERTELNKEKTGVELKGIKAINPVNQTEIPVWISDYVLAGYGTGAIMAVPAHDERDWEFAVKFNLPIKTVITTNKDNVIGVGAIIRSKDGKFIFQRRDHNTDRNPGMLAPFGGGCEKGEDTEMTLEREMKEELNLELNNNFTLFNKVESYNLPGKFLDIYFLRDIDDGSLVLGEGAGIEKYDLQEALVRDDVTPFTKNVIRCLLENKCFTDIDSGQMVNSEFLNGLVPAEAIGKMTAWLEEKGFGKKAINYKLRDWVFSRQRYWGEPIPLVYCENCKNKKQKVLLIHGFEGTGDGNWFAWIKKELEKAGLEVFSPTMTTSEHPVLEKWLEELMPFVEQMGEDDIIVGHSLGTKAALHLIERAGKKLKGLYLVAPVLNAASDKEYDLLSKEWHGSDIDLLKKFSSEPYDWQKIGDLVESKNVIFSDDDPFIKMESKDVLPAGWERQVWSGFGHFQKKEITELLNLISKSKNTGWVALPESELPLVLPEVKEFQAGDDGESPLSKETKWLATTCPKCGGPARRETDTMPQWAGSSWYFLRYIDPQNDAAFADEKKLGYWAPVDWYNGGMEHTTLHLLYSRFWHKFLFDLGYVPTAEPYAKRTSHGMVLGEGSEKMSKSRGNVVNPDQVIKDYGADTLRMYEMFMGPFDQAIPWDTKGVLGVRRFLEKVWNFYSNVIASVAKQSRGNTSDIGSPRSSANADSLAMTAVSDKELEVLLNKTVKKVGEDIETMHFNTAVSAMMILANKITDKKVATKEVLEKFLIILSPFAPHLAEELWEQLGHKESIALEEWPVYDEALIKDEQAEIVVQINGKVRAKILMPADIPEDEAVELARQNENVKKYLEGQAIKKTVFVPGKLISFVV